MKKYIRPLLLLVIILSGSMIQNSLLAQSTNTKETKEWYNGRQWLNWLSLKPHQTVNKREFEKH